METILITGYITIYADILVSYMFLNETFGCISLLYLQGGSPLDTGGKGSHVRPPAWRPDGLWQEEKRLGAKSSGNYACATARSTGYVRSPFCIVVASDIEIET